LANYWDTIKDAIASRIGQGLSAVGENVAAGFAGSFGGKIIPGADTTQVATAAAAPVKAAGQKVGKAAVGTLVKPAETIKADVAFNLGMAEAEKAYKFLYPKVTQPLTTSILTATEASRGNIPDVAANWELARPLTEEEN
jgi:hypothetical protein